MVKFFSQANWLGLNFRDLGIKTYRRQVAGAEFYGRFYEQLQSKYSSYDDFPLEWRLQKRDSAEFILKLINDPTSILSYGCGVGFFEETFVRLFGTNFYMTDYANIVKHFNPNSQSHYVENVHLLKKSYSHIILNQVSYALTDKQLADLLSDLAKLLLPKGVLIITFSELEEFAGRKSLERVNLALRRLLHLLRQRLKGEKFQGWGWHRSINDMITICRSVEHSEIRVYHEKHQVVILLAT